MKRNVPADVQHQIELSAPYREIELRGLRTHNTLQQMSCEGLEKDLATPSCNRARLDTGPFCNYNCEFCYYKDQLDLKIPWDVVKARIDRLVAYGIKQVDFSGGESSVSPDWFKALDYCSERFEHISCLSHGGKFANKEFLEESQRRGLKEILFSLHGSTAEIHDTITDRKGSFDRILAGIGNAKELGMVVRTNTTVYYRNYHLLPTIHADLINSIHPTETNFITLNYWGDWNVIKFDNASYSMMSDAIKQCIDKLDDGIEVNIRYAPYCYFKGYEKYIAGTYQHIYDVRDWNREMYSYTLDTSKTYTPEQKIDNAYEACQTHRERFYVKKMECMKCKHYYICDGIEKEIAQRTPVFPESGEKIRQVNFYRKDRDKRRG